MALRGVIGAAALWALSAGIATAAPGVIDRNTSVRSGPGTKYHVVARLRRGSVVDVSACSARWCAVAWRRGHGYVDRAALAGTAAGVAVAPAAPAYYEDYPGFEEPGYYVEPGYRYGHGVYVPPSWRHSGRWWHRHGGSAGRPQSPAGGTPAFRGQAGGVAPATGGVRGGAAVTSGMGTGARFSSGAVRGGAGAVSAPAASAPAVSAPAASAPAVSAPAAGGAMRGR